jgi:hypothetical protein
MTSVWITVAAGFVAVCAGVVPPVMKGADGLIAGGVIAFLGFVLMAGACALSLLGHWNCLAVPEGSHARRGLMNAAILLLVGAIGTHAFASLFAFFFDVLPMMFRRGYLISPALDGNAKGVLLGFAGLATMLYPAHMIVWVLFLRAVANSLGNTKLGGHLLILMILVAVDVPLFWSIFCCGAMGRQAANEGAEGAFIATILVVLLLMTVQAGLAAWYTLCLSQTRATIDSSFKLAAR